MFASNASMKSILENQSKHNSSPQDIHLGGWPLRNDDFSGGTKKCLEPWILGWYIDTLWNENDKSALSCLIN